MKNQIAPVEPQAFTPEQMKLITTVIARNATPDELQLFLYRCKILNLDPLKPGKIHFVKYGGGPGTIVIGIEGFRSFARKTGMLSGIKRGVIKDTKGVITYGWCEVYRKDWETCAREEVPFAEYNTGKASWLKMPETMIKKVAEAAALRMAFSDEAEGLGGIYSEEEFQKRLEENKYKVQAEQPAEGDGIQEEGLIMPSLAGPKLAGKLLQNIDIKVLIEWTVAAETKYKGKEMPPKTKQLYETVCDRIVEIENYEKPIELGEEEPEPGSFADFKP